MPRLPWFPLRWPARAPARRWRWSLPLALALVMAALMGLSPLARAEGIALRHFELSQSEDGLHLNFSTQFELARALDEAVQKGLPLLFVAEAEVYRSRWYWADEEINRVTRQWRLTYQPLTRQYRVTFAGISRSHESLSDALASMSSAAHWKLAERGQLGDGRYYVEFRYRLDLTQLPRPMQLSVTGQGEWQLRLERTQRLK